MTEQQAFGGGGAARGSEAVGSTARNPSGPANRVDTPQVGILLASALLLSGCYEQLSDEEVYRAVARCEREGGFAQVASRNGRDDGAYEVLCRKASGTVAMARAEVIL